MKTPDNDTHDEIMIVKAMKNWRNAFSLETVESILALYADDACLWGTLSPVQRTDPDSIRGYFQKAFLYEHRTVVFIDSKIRCYGDMAVSSGRYTFTFVKDGEKLSVPSRYSLVFKRRGGNWLIVEHHSSVIPDE